MSWIESKAKSIAEFVYRNFEAKGSGNMILLTTMAGIALSTIAQTIAIIANNKYSAPQKAFMIPQELTDGCITILSVLLITTPLQKLSHRSVNAGKIYSKEMGNYMKKHDLFNKRDIETFNFADQVTKIIEKIKKSDEFIKSSNENKEAMLKEHNNILQDYDIFTDATSAIAATTGSIVSTAIVSPFIRNYTASKYQQLNMNIYDRLPHTKKDIKQNNNTTFKSVSYYYLNPCKF